MKRFIVIAACIVFAAWGCGKDLTSQSSCSGAKATADTAQLLAFAKKYGITPAADTSWMYYQVINSGTGATPTPTSKVFVRYVGRLMDGTYFDSVAVSTRFSMDSLIKGWQYGLPKIKTGGRIKLLVPSALALGCEGNGSTIPPGAPLYFDIYLDSLK